MGQVKFQQKSNNLNPEKERFLSGFISYSFLKKLTTMFHIHQFINWNSMNLILMFTVIVQRLLYNMYTGLTKLSTHHWRSVSNFKDSHIRTKENNLPIYNFFYINPFIVCRRTFHGIFRTKICVQLNLLVTSLLVTIQNCLN